MLSLDFVPLVFWVNHALITICHIPYCFQIVICRIKQTGPENILIEVVLLMANIHQDSFVGFVTMELYSRYEMPLKENHAFSIGPPHGNDFRRNH